MNRRKRSITSAGVVTVAFAAVTVPFASSLHIVQPGPRVERAGLAYSLTLKWTSRSGANAYRVLAWTDAAGSWYRMARTSETAAPVHAYRSGCTEFVVVAIKDSGGTEATLDTTNAVRFPLSTNRSLCKDP